MLGNLSVIATRCGRARISHAVRSLAVARRAPSLPLTLTPTASAAVYLEERRQPCVSRISE